MTFKELETGAAFRWVGQGHPVMEKVRANRARVMETDWYAENVDPDREVEETTR